MSLVLLALLGIAACASSPPQQALARGDSTQARRLASAMAENERSRVSK